MRYITFRHYRGRSFVGEIDLQRGTVLKEGDGWLFCDRGGICVASSEIGRQHFSRDDDCHGLERGGLTYAIAYAPRSADCPRGRFRFTEEECNFLCEQWGKYLCQLDFLIFNADFFAAPIEDLREIATALNIRFNTET